MTLDQQIEGRVSDNEPRFFSFKQRLEGMWIAGVAAEQAMVAQLPKIAQNCYRWSGLERRNFERR